SEDPMVGANQKLSTLEMSVEREFRAIMPEGITVTARVQWISRGGRPIVRRYKLIKAACLALASKIKVAAAANISGATTADIERVALMLYNGSGTLADTYNVLKDEKRDIGPAFPFASAREWLEGNGILAELGADSSASVAKPTSSESENEEADQGGRSAYHKESPRPEGSHRAKRRRMQEDNTRALANAVASIADSQQKRLRETTRKVNIAVMQSPDVPLELRQQFFSKLAQDIMRESCPSGSVGEGAGEGEDGEEEK
ncbi:hypothetical protein MMPV_009082, partial [Pyropia vietnamensis]